MSQKEVENPDPTPVMPPVSGEGTREIPAVAAAIVCFFLIITAYYVLKPVRESLALELGATRIPALNIFSMFTLVLANGIYSWTISRFSRTLFIPVISGFFVVCMLLFWQLFSRPEFQSHTTAASLTFRTTGIAGFFIWLNLFILFAVSMFWSFVNDHFSPEQGKRLYSLIGMGGLCGGLLGGTITSRLVAWLGTANLFPVAALIYLPSVFCLLMIERYPPSPPRIPEQSPPVAPPQPVSIKSPTTSGGGMGKTSALSQALSGARITFNSVLLTLLAVEMFLYTFGSTIFSFQINQLMEKTLQGRDERTLYWAYMYNWINGVSILFQIGLTTFVMRLSRPWLGMMLIPLWQVFGNLLLFRFPTLSTAAVIGVIRYAMDYSLARAVREFFFTAVTREEKYQGKGFIDTMVFRAGDGAAAALLLSWTAFFPTAGWVDLFATVPWLLSLAVLWKAGLALEGLLKRLSPQGSPPPLAAKVGRETASE